MTDRASRAMATKLRDADGRDVGYVTSGSPAPFLKKNIALAYVPTESAALGTELKVEIRGQGVESTGGYQLHFTKNPKKT